MDRVTKKQQTRIKRQKRIRKKVYGTVERPRLIVYRSNKHIYAQIINDVDRVTMVSASDKEVKAKTKPIDIAKEVGLNLAKKAKAKKIESVVFDRRGYKYHGRVKALADGSREGGLTF